MYQGKAQARVRSYFEDVQAAARSLFEDSTQLAWSTTYLFHNVTKPADLTRLQKMYGPKEWMVCAYVCVCVCALFNGLLPAVSLNYIVIEVSSWRFGPGAGGGEDRLNVDDCSSLFIIRSMVV